MSEDTATYNEQEQPKVSTISYFDDRFYKVTLNEVERLIVKGLHDIEAEEVFLPSSTTMLGIISQPFLAKWRGDIGNEVADYRTKIAMQKGSNIHAGIEKLWQGEALQAEAYPQDEWLQFCRFHEWHKEFQPKLVAAEHSTYSLKHLYAGTLDFIGEFKGGKLNCGYSKPVDVTPGIYIGDWKTGKGISNSYFYQLASYAMAEEERRAADKLPIEIQGAFILHLQAETKQGWKCILRNREELEADFETFLHSAAVWKRENANLTPKIIQMPSEIRL